MFQRNKNSYRVVVFCKNGDKENRYTFIEDYDDDWGEVAKQKFYNEFGIYPNEMSLEVREKL